MNKKLLEMLEDINNKKAEVKQLVNDGKLDEAKAAKEELVNMQARFDLLKDIEDEAPDKKKLEDKKPAAGIDAAFADAARHGFRNALTEGVQTKGGYTVPQDIQTRINQRRQAKFSLEDLISVENVKTETGSRVYQKKNRLAGFSEVGEGAAIPEGEEPEFERINYAVKKYAGYLAISNELLEDSDANITATITNWIGDQSRATRNRLIVKALIEGKTTDGTTNYAQINSIDDITRALNITIGADYKDAATITTNDYGLQVLGALKDGNNRPLLNPVPTDPAKMQIAVGATIVPVHVVPTNSLGNITVAEKEYAPFIIGDLKDAVKMYDRQTTTIKASDTAATKTYNAFEDDLVLYRATEREDVKVVDSDAYVLGYYSTKEASSI